MDWETAALISQVIATILTGVGVVISIWLGIAALREARQQRLQHVQPRMLFDRGGQSIPAEVYRGHAIPGIDRNYAKFLLRHFPQDAPLCRPAGPWARLRNHGTGSALNVAITFFARKIVKANEEFTVDAAKQREFPYSEALNRLPAAPSNIAPGEEGRFFRFPTMVVVDATGQLSLVEGFVRISYYDVFGNPYEAWQKARISIDGKSVGERDVTITIGEEVPSPTEVLALAETGTVMRDVDA